MKSILDPSFRYRASFETDLQKTFARIRRAQRRDKRQADPPSDGGQAGVLPFSRRRQGAASPA